MNDLLALLLGIAGGLAAMGVIWKSVLIVYRIVRKIEQAHDLILEFPIWQADVNRSLGQLHPNGGHSIKDVVDKTKTEVTALKELVESHQNDASLHNINN